MNIVGKKIEYAGPEEILTLDELEFEIKGLENAIAQAQELKTRLEQTMLLIKIQESEQTNEQTSED